MEYDMQVKQWIRAKEMGDTFDRDISALFAQAKIYQLKLRELKSQV